MLDNIQASQCILSLLLLSPWASCL